MQKTFENLAQRGIHYFIATTPSFCAVESQFATEEEQENAHNFIKSIYSRLYENPGLLGLKIYPDDCFEFWWSKRSEKPGLVTRIRGYIKNINMFIETIYKIVCFGETEGDAIIAAEDAVKPVMLKKLAKFGITKSGETYIFPEGTVKGLKLLASISEQHARQSATAIHGKATSPFLLFSRGVFAPDAPYTAEIFRGIFENKESYDRLIAYFNSKGFIRIDNKESKTGLGGNNISLDYVTFYGKPEGVVGESWKTKNLGGISFSCDELNQEGSRVGIHIPYFSEVLENADKMSPSLRGFIAHWNKCNGCRYCVQMDKTKTKPLRFFRVNESNICAVYTFGYTFNQFYDGTWLADGVMELMDFVDELFADRRVDVL